MSKCKYTSIDEIPLTVDVEEFCKIVGVGRNTAYALVRSRKVRSLSCGKKIIIPKEAIVEFLKGSAA